MSASGTIRSRLHKLALAALAGLVIFSSSGCVLLWLGAGGAGGYLIRKGEGEGGSKKEKTEAGGQSSLKKSE
jgi:hypothetical protein